LIHGVVHPNQHPHYISVLLDIYCQVCWSDTCTARCDHQSNSDITITMTDIQGHASWRRGVVASVVRRMNEVYPTSGQRWSGTVSNGMGDRL